MVAKLQKLLGNGMYTIPEAALYARISPAVMTRWLFGTKSGKSVIDPQFGRDDRIVSFLDLVQTLAIREIRLQKKVPLPKFRQAIKVAKNSFNLDYPFARKHCTYYRLANQELVIRPPGADDYFEVSGGRGGQGLLAFVEIYLENLDFNTDGLASCYRVYDSVVMDPHRRFGEPLLPSGYTAKAIWDSIRVEGSIERAVHAYGIPRIEVETAYKFFVDYLGKTIA